MTIETHRRRLALTVIGALLSTGALATSSLSAPAQGGDPVSTAEESIDRLRATSSVQDDPDARVPSGTAPGTAAGAARSAASGVGPLARAKKQTNTFYVVVIKDSKRSGDFSAKRAKALTKKAANYWVKESRGHVARYTYKATSMKLKNSCTYEFFDLMKRAAKKYPSVNFYGTRNHLVVFRPTECGDRTGVGGMATLGEVGAWNGGTMVMQTRNWGAMAHELGHNFGLGHTGVQARIQGERHSFEYGSFFGPMGAFVSTLTPTQQQLLGVPGNSKRTKTYRAKSKTKTYKATLYAPTSGGKKLTQVRVVDRKGRVFSVEFRAGTGRDKSADYAARGGAWMVGSGVLLPPNTGVVVTRWKKGGTYDGPSGMVVGKATASRGQYNLKTAWGKGKKITAPGSAVVVKVVSTSRSAAKVTITVKKK